MILESNNLTIYETQEIKKYFIELIQKDEIIIDLKEVRKVDMSAIQLLLSLQKSCVAQNKTFEIKNVNEEVLNALETTGTAYILGV